MKKLLSLLAAAQPLLLAALMYAVASRFAPLGVDAHHDGIMFKPALDIAEGKMLFRDTFTQYGALTALLQALALKIFGRYLLVIRLETAFFYALTVYFLWLVWERFIPKWLATVCGLVFICMSPYLLNLDFPNHSPNFGWWLLPWSSVYGLFFLVLSLYLLILFVERRAWQYLAAAGASVALTLWCRQSVGVLLFCAAAFFVACLPVLERTGWKKSLNYSALFLSGFAAVSALFLAWLMLNHSLKDMWLQSYMFSVIWAREVSPPLTYKDLVVVFFPPYNKFSSSPSYVWSALPSVCLLLFFRTSALYLRKKRFDVKHLALFAAVLVSLASWGQYYPVNCERHTYWAIAPMIGVFAYFVRELLSVKNVYFGGVGTLLVLGWLFHDDITHRVRGAGARLRREYVTLTYPEVLKGMRTPAHDALFFRTIASDIDDYFSRNPGGGLVNLSLDALFPAFVENLYNFHPLHMSWPRFGIETALYPDYPAKLAKYAADHRPIVISHTEPVIYAGYTVLSVGRDMYVTAPGAPGSAWQITAFRAVDREPDPPLGAARNYRLDLQYAGTRAAGIRAIGVTASDFNGAGEGAWRPVAQSTSSITLGYSPSPSNSAPRPLGREFISPPGGKVRLLLTGHDFPHYAAALKVAVTVVMNDNTRFRQVISFLPLFEVAQKPKPGGKT